MAARDLQIVLGRNVRALRERAGMSQEAFGDQVGLHRTYVGGVERGERNLTLQTVSRLGEVLGVGPLALLIDWDRGELPRNPHEVAAKPARRSLRAAADGADPGGGGRAVAKRTGRPRPTGS
jgi:transcriptional regulator with XRE-family HTH domain